jgi:3-oxoacyl-[acyl-carrier protein] reductase
MTDTPDPPPVHGGYALVTGGSRGIGAAVARRLARQGHDVLIGYRSRADAADAVAAEVRTAGRQAWTAAFDVSDRAATASCLERVLAERGVPWAVVLSAGITRDGLLAGMSGEDWDLVLATGLDGFYNVLRPLIGPMLKARRGRIVTVASVSGQMGNAGQVNYAAAKGGLIAATKALAREAAKRSLTANVVAPGLIDTEMIAHLPLGQLLQAVPMARLGTVDEVAAAVAFLCSGDAGYITGQVLGINGGLYT